MKQAHDLVMHAKQQIKEIDINTAEHELQNADIIIDVREPDEYQAGHLPGAINIPRGLLEFKLSADPSLEARDRAILLYCKTSGRAALAAVSMKEMGYLNVTSITGGYDAWHEAGKAVAKPTLPSFE